LLSSSSRHDYVKRLKRRFYAATGRPYPHLLSIHIPKTAGRTFQKILCAQYGIDGVLSLNHHYLDNQGEKLTDYPTEAYPVIHGHLSYKQISAVGNAHSKYITWLRHPVDRVLSNYHYYAVVDFQRRKKQRPNAKLIDIETFIKRPLRQNKMSTYLEGINLEGFFFIGFQSQFESDLKKLGSKLNWSLDSHLLKLRVNDNQKAKQAAPGPSEELIAKIREYNYKDLVLYEKARRLALQGFWD